MTIAEVMKAHLLDCVIIKGELYCPSHGVVLKNGVKSLLDFAVTQNKRILQLEAELKEAKAKNGNSN